MKKFSTKRLCRAGVIAALYAALTYAFTPVAFGPMQVRPAEALCLLPLLFPEAIFALTIGCALSNISSPYAVYDVIFGSLSTLFAAFITYLTGRFIKKEGIKLFVGGIPPILCNALILPLVLVFLNGSGGETSLLIAYLTCAGSIALSQSVWIYALGIPLYFSLKKRE